jgi:stage II sporulation protein D
VQLRLSFIIVYLIFNTSVLSSYSPVRQIEEDKLPFIRVRIKKALKKVVISGTDLLRKFHLNNKTKKFRGRKSIKFNCHNFTRVCRPKNPVLLASLTSQTGLVSFNLEKYSGLLHIVTSENSESCDVIQELNLENYISTLLSKEMNGSWPVEALKAQAIAARTYAYHKMQSKQVARMAGFETYYHLENSEKHQVGGSFFDSTENTRQATSATKGEILANGQGAIRPIFFHAKCGGQTLRPDQVWTNRVSGYASVRCPFCKGHGQRGFRNSLSMARFKKFLRWQVKKKFLKAGIIKHLSQKLRIVPHSNFSRRIYFYLGDRRYSFKKPLLRRYFGRVIFPSNNFVFRKLRGKKGKPYFSVSGDGLGHGVGLCQLGALDLAQKGWDYKRILAHYFPAHKIKKIY